MILSPCSLIEDWVAIPTGITTAPLIFDTLSIVMGSIHPWSTSFVYVLSRAGLLVGSDADLWLPRLIM